MRRRPCPPDPAPARPAEAPGPHRAGPAADPRTRRRLLAAALRAAALAAALPAEAADPAAAAPAAAPAERGAPQPAGPRYRLRAGETHRLVADRNPLHDQTVALIETATDDELTLSAQNRGVDAVELRLTELQADNLQVLPARPLQQRWLLPPDGVPVPLLQLRIADPAQPPAWRYRTRITPGDSRARPDGTLYRLPFARGARFRLSQGFGGALSHHDAQNRHAVDFMMPPGTPVHAARGGVVVDFRRDGPDGTGRMADTNFLVIRHADGTYGQYAHLDARGPRLRLGQVVAEGEVIAWSGNSGQSNGPHLHFSVAVSDGEGGRITVPWLFKDAEGEAFMPRPGHAVGHDDG